MPRMWTRNDEEWYGMEWQTQGKTLEV